MENEVESRIYKNACDEIETKCLSSEEQTSESFIRNHEFNADISNVPRSALKVDNQSYDETESNNVFTADSFCDEIGLDENTGSYDEDMNSNMFDDNAVSNADVAETNYQINKGLSEVAENSDKNGINKGLHPETEQNICSDGTELKKKKRRRRRREHHTKCTPEDCDCPDGRDQNRKMKRRKKRRHLEQKRYSVDSGVENSGFVPESEIERNYAQELVQNIPENELWLGKDLLQRNNIDMKHVAENKYLRNDNLSLKLDLNGRQSTPSFPQEHLFIASEFSPRSELPTKRSDSLDTVNYAGIYKKRSGVKKKRRLGDLKRTSSKVSIVQTLPPLSTRIELDPTARTVRTHRGLREGSETNETDGIKDSLWFCKIITKFPLLSFFVITLIHIATIGSTVGLVFSGYDVFPAVFEEVPLYIYNDARLKELAWRARGDFKDLIYRPVFGGGLLNTGYRSRVKDTVEIIFEKPGVNILTAQHLRWIRTAEEQLFSDIDYQRDYCLLDHRTNCVKPQSLIRLFDGTYSHIDAVFNDEDFKNVTEVLYKASVYNETKEFLDIFISKDSVITQHESYSSITRTAFVMGWPLSILQDGTWGTLERLTDFLADSFKPKIENVRDYFLIERLDVYYISKILYEHDLVEQAMKDIMLAIGSVSFIFVFMCFQTGSVVLTSLGILSILSSFLLTNIFYRYVFQFKYFGFFHVISLFLILGIGADDLFVFYDTWRLTGHTHYPTDAHRLSDCYRKAAKTTFVTSLTTMMAFLVSGLSPLLPVKTFGIFTGVLVAVNYIWVVIYFPSIIMIHHTRTKYMWRRFRLFLLSLYLTSDVLHDNIKSSTSVETSSVSETNSSRELLHNQKVQNTEKTNDSRPDAEKNTAQVHNGKPKSKQKPDVSVNMECNTNEASKKTEDAVPKFYVDHEENRRNYLRRRALKRKKNFEERNKIVKFLKNTFFDIMTKRIIKIMVPLMFLGVSIFFIHRATMIEPDTQQLRLFRSSHNYAKAAEKHFSFRRNPDDEYQRLYIVWGMLPVDIDYCDQKSAEFCFGRTRYDPNIDMNTKTAQLAFKDLCSHLDNLQPDMMDKLRIQKDVHTSKPKINCFVGDMEHFFENKLESGFPNDLNITLPSDSDSVQQLMDTYRLIYRYPVPDDFKYHFEILLSYWLTDGYKLTPTADYFSYNELLPERYIPGVTKDAYYSGSGIYYGGKLQYVAIEVNTTMNVYSLGYEEGLPIYNEWENFMREINEMMPFPFNNGFQATENLWHWLHVQETLASSAITGILVGLFTAWPILVITTMNVIIGTIATVTIGLVTACVIGLIPLVGWKLGVLESIILCMVVGLSVDYIVHLAEAYRMSKSARRLDRVHDMLESIGLSVISGAITTMGAAMFMLFAQIQFFFQFGVFILSTVGISLLFSLLGFTTLLSLCGPEKDTGSLPDMIKGIVEFCRRGQVEDTDDEDPTKSKPSCCPCASPSVIVDRIYDWLSYKTSKDFDSDDKKRSRYR